MEEPLAKSTFVRAFLHDAGDGAKSFIRDLVNTWRSKIILLAHLVDLSEYI